MEIDWRFWSILSVPFTLSNRLLFSNDQILSTKSVFLAFQFVDILKFSAKSLQTGNQQCGTEFLLHDIKNSCCHHILSLLWDVCRCKDLQKTLLDGRNLLKMPVALHDDGCFVGIDIGLTRLPKLYPSLWALLPEALGKFPHRYEQLCSSLWAKMLIVMGWKAHRYG